MTGRGSVSESPDLPPQQRWAGWFTQQAAACEELGSPLYGRLLELLAEDILASGTTWNLVRNHDGLRFGQAPALRLLGAAHRLALSGEAPEWAAVLPSCGGIAPDGAAELWRAWQSIVDIHHEQLVAGLDREVQTNEVARAAGLALAVAETRFAEARLVEIGASGGLNLHLDGFEIDLGGIVLGDAGSPVHLHPEIVGHLGGLRHSGLSLPRVTERVGVDTHPVDPTDEAGRLTLLSFVWPDQSERLARLRAAIEVARSAPGEMITAGSAASGDTAEVLSEVLGRGGASIVSHSIVWQYIPTDLRWRTTEVIEHVGGQSTSQEPLAWIRYEPDQWDRRRAAVHLRTWPHGGDRVVAHVDYHGRWLEPL